MQTCSRLQALAGAFVISLAVMHGAAAQQPFGGQTGPYGQGQQGPYGQGQQGPYGQGQTNPSFQGQPNPSYGGGGSYGPSLVGAWSSDRAVSGIMAHGTTVYGRNGEYVAAAQMANGLTMRVWGHYRTRPMDQNRMAVDFQAEGWLPRVLCSQAAGQQPVCQPFNLPANTSSVVTFTSPNSLQSFDPQQPAQGVTNEFRDQNPYLLQRQVPEQEVVYVQAPPQAPVAPAPGPIVGGSGGGYRPLAPSTGPRCDDLQQRRICAINDGNLVSSGGCLVCVKN